MPRQVPSMSIRLLGPLEVAVGGRAIVVDTRKALAIVALVAAEGRPFARDELAAIFWPEADGDAARGALRRTLSSLRTAVGDSGLVIERTQVSLDPATVRVDLTELERFAASSRLADLEVAAALATGPFLAGFALRDSPDFDAWMTTRAMRVERTVGDVLERLAAARLGEGDVEGAVEAARRRVALDPLDELGQRRLIELLAVSGDRSGAIRQYRDMVGLFDRELGVAPLTETTELYDLIREGGLDVARASQPRVVVVPTHEDPPRLAPLVGRDQELATMRSAWRASAPDGGIVLLEGEAGIGKTRLAEALDSSVRADGGIVLAARGYPGEEAIAYGPVAELLRAGLATEGGAFRLEALGETARTEIGRLVDLPVELRPARGAGTGSSDVAGATVRLLDAIAEALSALAAGRVPGLIWVDDLHLVDHPTQEAVAYLARRLAGRPLLLLLAWRPEDLEPGDRPTADDLMRLPRATPISLRRLDRDGVAALARAMRPADTVDDTLIDTLVADSEGLPLHVVAALTSGEPLGAAVPRSVHELLRGRIRSVGETAAQIVSAAAVIGRSFDLATVRATSGRSEEETVDALEELTRRGIVREVPGAAEASIRYDFVHGRLRDVAYEATSRARRRLLHRRTAAALRADTSAVGRDDLVRFARIAGHEREAGRHLEASEAFLEAAARAEAVFANREAIDHLESVIAIGDRDDTDVHARIGELRSRLGEYPAAIAALETAAALATPSELAAIEIALGRVHQRRGDLVAAASHLGSALASPDVTERLRTTGLVELSVVALRAGDLEVAGPAALEASQLAVHLADPHLVGVAERLVGLVAHAGGDLPGARAALERSVTMAQDDPDPTAAIAASIGLALVLSAEGEHDQAVALAATAVEACQRIGDRHLEAAVENHLADILHDADRTEDSMVHLKRAVALFAEVGVGAPEDAPGIWALAAW